MQSAGIIQSERNWSHGLLRLIALLSVALHLFAVQGHIHSPQFGSAAAHTGAHHDDVGVWSAAARNAQTGALTADSTHTASNLKDPGICVFCQTRAAAGSELAPNRPPMAFLLGAAALVAAPLDQRRVALQRLTIWRSRAPPNRV